MTFRAAAFSTLFLLLCGATAAHDAPLGIDAALERARNRHLPVLIDFQAQWCYSCYFMDSHVLTGAEWDATLKRAVLAEADADSPDGAMWMKKLGVTALPSYVVLNAEGRELGRIVAEQPRNKFYPALARILGGEDAIDTLKTRASQGSMPELATALAVHAARGQVAEGLAWFATLPDGVAMAAQHDKLVATRLAQLEMEKAAKDKDAPVCIAAARRVLAGDPGCDRYSAVDTLLGCSESLPPRERQALLIAQRPALNALLDKQVFVATPGCADQRSAVFAAADLAKALGDASAEQAVLSRGIAAAQRTLAGDLRRDRNAADNLRVYLVRAGRTAEVDALMPKLIAAYPDDYVYAWRHGRSLLERGQAAAALPLLERAAQRAFGVNRLGVASARAKALLALNRRADAERVVAEALDANGPWFPEQAAKLKAVLKP